MRTVLRSLAVLAIVVLAIVSSPAALALQAGDTVEDFRLIDEQGVSHQLSYLSDRKAIVIMTQGNGCQIVRSAVPGLKEIRDQYQARGVEFLMMNSNLQDDRASVVKESKEFDYQIPIMLDDTQLIGESLGVTRTAEVFVIDPKNWHLMYHGPVDDRLSYGTQKAQATHPYLIDALNAVLAGQPVKVTSAQSAGCLVEMPEANNAAEHAKISYSRTIAPLLERKCVSCHRDGGGGASFSMASYQSVKGAAAMMREVVRVQHTPPPHADSHYGTLTGSGALTAEQAQDLVHWIDAGAPRGAGPDPLLKGKTKSAANKVASSR